ncbi:MAG: hypothetical protein KatS3mg105_2956 [Gemmatales bacterium]|nr:MAG: hypothetical protein KatS3mg105_2956 [Gemmatales bacterium]
MRHCRYAEKTWLLAVVVIGIEAAVGLAQTPPPAAVGDGPPASNSDIELVERLIAARRDYQTALERLRRHYLSTGDVERARWAEQELLEFHRIDKRAFRLELDVPPPTLRASYNVPAANELYRRAMSYKDRGWGTDYIDNQRRAEILFQQILTSYPQCDKIDDAAYQLGTIYESKAYRHYRRAALYYERCVQWNPNTQYDARLRAARLYDRVLSERRRAIELYREILTHETDPQRLDEAKKRLQVLAGS